MKKSTHIVLIALSILTFNNTSFSMAPAVAVGEVPAEVVDYNPLGLPSKFSLSIPTSTWLSGVGAFISCLGGLLMYQGAVKRAQPTAEEKNDLNPQPEPSVEGNQLLTNGSLFLLAGMLMIVLSPNAK